jgi:hypothetical protein
MTDSVTFNTTVIESDDLRQKSAAPDIYICTQRVDDWRRGKDFVYRILTSLDTRELNECVLGLISSGEHGTNVGLLRSKYAHIINSMQLIHSIECDILNSEMRLSDPEHRVTCHFLIFVALVLEPDFIKYALLGTYNREAMRYYINDVLRPTLARLLTGNLMRDNSEQQNAFEVVTFVRQARHSYSLYCLPTHIDCTI